ncbi:MAG TPA: HEAT repeat domain-containing protein [Thermoanaerobaculia bacterium]|nr:HEAT repeat domain-containing protein [Thermoanaerobaculia bacterium]
MHLHRSGIVLIVLFFFSIAPVYAQGSAAELIAELKSGDSTRCMNASNATSEHQESYQEMAAELAPALFEILEKGPCSDNALSALVNLGHGIAEGISAEVAIPILVRTIERGLESSGPHERLWNAGSAALVTGHFGAKAGEAVPVLSRWILEAPDFSHRRYGLDAVARIGDPAAAVVPALLDSLAPPAEDDEKAWEKNEFRVEIVRAFGSIPAAVAHSGPALVAALRSEDSTFSYVAAESLSTIGPGVVPYLVPVLSDPAAEPRAQALRILGGMGPAAADASAAIAPLIADQDWTVTYEAGEALRQIGPTAEGIAALSGIAGNAENEDAARAAAEILGGYGSAAKEALPALRRAAAGKNWLVADAAKQAIAAIESGE